MQISNEVGVKEKVRGLTDLVSVRVDEHRVGAKYDGIRAETQINVRAAPARSDAACGFLNCRRAED